VRRRHENVATVLVDPRVLGEFELRLMTLDQREWPVRTAPICTDGARMAFQIRRKLVMKQRGAWDLAADWTPVWIAFGARWHNGDEPLPWAAHRALWHVLDTFADHVRFHRRLGGVPLLPLPEELR
jgi:hypothetical protein